MPIPHSRTELLRLGFFAVLLAYLLLLLTDMPAGLSGLFPIIVIAFVGVLLGYRLVTIIAPGRVDRLADTGTAGLRRLGIDTDAMGSSDGFLDQAVDADTDGTGTDVRGMTMLLAWTLAGFVLVYLLGIVIGSLLYITSFLSVRGDHDIEFSVIVSFLVTGLMLVVIFAFSLPLWEGLVFTG